MYILAKVNQWLNYSYLAQSIIQYRVLADNSNNSSNNTTENFLLGPLKIEHFYVYLCFLVKVIIAVKGIIYRNSFECQSRQGYHVKYFVLRASRALKWISQKYQ